eukprot:1508269-Alexandrium_andersonii.AAC.1
MCIRDRRSRRPGLRPAAVALSAAPPLSPRSRSLPKVSKPTKPTKSATSSKDIAKDTAEVVGSQAYLGRIGRGVGAAGMRRARHVGACSRASRLHWAWAHAPQPRAARNLQRIAR